MLTMFGCVDINMPNKTVADILQGQYKIWKGTPHCDIAINDTNCTDCSGLVQLVYKESFGVDLPGSVESIFNKFKNKIIDDKDSLRNGDLLVFQKPLKYGYPYHIGIYINYNLVDCMLHVSSKKGVEIIPLGNYWSKEYKWVGSQFNIVQNPDGPTWGAIRIKDILCQIR